jgi:predicted DCC family thiol-disulfide oxidoreductase YuxK
VNTEITDNIAPPSAGWVFYDAECAFCARGAAQLAGLFGNRGFVWLPLQSPSAVAALGSHATTMHEQMKLRLANGHIASGIDAWAVLLRSVWWLWPVGVLLGLPGIRQFGDICYGWLARNRYCISGRCRVTGRDPRSIRHSAFFQMP